MPSATTSGRLERSTCAPTQFVAIQIDDAGRVMGDGRDRGECDGKRLRTMGRG